MEQVLIQQKRGSRCLADLHHRGSCRESFQHSNPHCCLPFTYEKPHTRLGFSVDSCCVLTQQPRHQDKHLRNTRNVSNFTLLLTHQMSIFERYEFFFFLKRRTYNEPYIITVCLDNGNLKLNF